MAVLAVLGSCVLVVLVAWASVIGPSDVFSGPGPTPSTETTTTTATPTAEAEGTGRDGVEQRRYGPTASLVINLVGGAIQLAAFLLMVGAVFLLLRRGKRAWELRRRYERPPSMSFAVVTDGAPERVRDAIRDDAAAQHRLLLEGEPRNAIVACWHRFEAQAERAGLPRHAWETSSEFALRMLDVAAVDPGSVSKLLTLYREARFSEHDLGEVDRQAARAALTQIQSQVGSRLPSEST